MQAELDVNDEDGSIGKESEALKALENFCSNGGRRCCYEIPIRCAEDVGLRLTEGRGTVIKVTRLVCAHEPREDAFDDVEQRVQQAH